MERSSILQAVQEAFQVHPIVALLGPRQVGKTTVARQYIERYAQDMDLVLNYFDLEDPTALARLENPKLALDELSGLVVIDEVQRRPQLFQYLRVLVDRPKNNTTFLILGSASRDLIRQSSETLAGRIGYLEIHPFSLFETLPQVGGIKDDNIKSLWLRGGYPRSYLADSDEISWKWRNAYIRTFLERDIPALGIQIPPQSLRRFWMMLSHCHGQMFNASAIGRSLGLGDTTVARYLDILAGTFMIRRLTPWHENIGKRQVKRPKVYFRDSGLYHALSGIQTYAQLQTHPQLGASWEGFAFEEVLRLYGVEPEEAYFWAVHGQAELDLFVLKDGKRMAFEFKFTDSPKLTKSMRTAAEILRPDLFYVVCPGTIEVALSENIRAVGLRRLLRKRQTATELTL